MTSQIKPSVTNPTIADIYQAIDAEKLVLRPDFQRKFVWTAEHQEAFLNVWRTASRFDAGRGNPTAWLLTLVHRRAVDAVRRQQKHSYEQVDEQHVQGEESDFRDLDFSPRAVRAQLALLPRRDRELLVWAHYEGLSQTEIARRAGIPLGTVKSRMFHAYGKLRAAFDSLVHASEVATIERSAFPQRDPG